MSSRNWRCSADYKEDLNQKPGRLDPFVPVHDFKSNVGRFNQETREFIPSTPSLQLGPDQFRDVEPNLALRVDALGNIHGPPRFEKTDTGFRPASDIIGRMDVGGTVRPPIQADTGPDYIVKPPTVQP